MAERFCVCFHFWISVSFVCLGLQLSTQTSTSTLSPQTTETFGFLPEGWDHFCVMKPSSELTKRLDYKCEINKENSGLWRLDTLRYWISLSNVSYTMDVSCREGANISLPWPMKALNLVGIKATNCIVEDYFTDRANTMLKSIPDQLTFLDQSNLVIVIRNTDMMTLATAIDELDKDYQCGSEDTIVEVVDRNITFRFHDEIMEFIMSNNNSMDIMDLGDIFSKKVRNIPFKCIYLKLRSYDKSISYNRGKDSIELTTETSRFPELKFFNLSQNGISQIHSQIQRWYRYFDKLEYMDLSRNLITDLEFDDTVWAYEGDIPDFTMNLSYNRISQITANQIIRLTKIPNMFIDLTGNPINCTCSDEMKQLLQLLHNSASWKKPSYQRYEYIKEMQCASPLSLRGRTLVSLQDENLNCELEYITNYGAIIGLSIFALFLIGVIIALAKFRREIRILTYTRFNIILPCQSEELFENKMFDAFVSYSNADQEWVSKVFENIADNENMGKFKFCLHHKDFIPGKTIFDNVIDSVETSRHTVIVLSRNFLSSHYCMYEFHEAFQQSIIERKKHLIVILLEDIPMSELPNDLKRCLKTFTYIRKDDIIFEDRLVFALSYKGLRLSKGRSYSESTSKTMSSQTSRETDVTSDGNMSPSIISNDSVFPSILTKDDFISKEKSEFNV